MIKNCLQCNKEFRTIPAKVKIGWGKYCSSGCYTESQKINKKGASNPNWRGGVGKCADCGGALSKFSYPKRGTKRCFDCSLLHRGGENSSNWKGGISKQKSYRVFASLKHRNAKKSSGGTHTLEQWNKLKESYNHMCLCCKQQEPFIKLTEDHIIPLSMGGSNDISNIQPLCRSCNSRKMTKATDYRTVVENNYNVTKQ